MRVCRTILVEVCTMHVEDVVNYLLNYSVTYFYHSTLQLEKIYRA